MQFKARQGARAFPSGVDFSEFHIFAASGKVRKPLDAGERIRKRGSKGPRCKFSCQEDRENIAPHPKMQ
jgi:hypothetical protein